MTDREWTTSEIVDDPRIDHDDPRVRAAAERLHANESIDKHHRIGDRVCVYCALRASTALRALEAAGYAWYRPDDCMELEACAHCVTASIPLEHRMEEFYLVPVGEVLDALTGGEQP